MTWDEVLNRNDIVGGEIEKKEGESFYRGPIKSITKCDNKIIIELEWYAKMESIGSWVIWDITVLSVPCDIEPQNIYNGRIIFNLPDIGPAIIYPVGTSKLDPKQVLGLKL